MSARWRRIVQLVRPYRGTLAVAFLAMLVQSGAELLEPWPLKVVFDNVFGSKPAPAWLRPLAGVSPETLLSLAAAALVAIVLLGAASSFAQKYLATSVGQRMMHDLRHLLYQHVQRLSLSFFEQRQTGDMVVRLTSDIDAAQDFISSIFLGVLFDLLTLTGMLMLMLYLDWRFTIVALLIAPVLFGVVYHMTRRIRAAARALKKKEGDIASVVLESLSSARIVKAFGREAYEVDRLDRESQESVDLALRARAIKARLSPMVDAIVAVGTGLLLIIGGRLVLRGDFTSGSLLVFVLYLGKMYKPMKDLSKTSDTISKAMVSFERIGEILDTETRIRDRPDARVAPRFRGNIEFADVGFSYEGRRRVFEGLDLSLRAGETAAIVGATGAGKSTLLALLLRLYDIDEGRILIDGTDIRAYTIVSLRDQISLVLQDSILFRGTIRQNIAYGKPTATDEEIARAARLAHADEFIVHLPLGMNTIVGERGDTLSGGQRQRIAIARAIVRDTPILLLDEPTAALDSESEELVLDALGHLMQGRTCITVAHRLSTARRAQRIFVLDRGVIVESGSHDELLSLGGLYSRLSERQFGRVPA